MLRVLEGSGSGTGRLGRVGLGRKGCDELGSVQLEVPVAHPGETQERCEDVGVGSSSRMEPLR